MKKNFKLTKESKVNWEGRTLFRIQATATFSIGTSGPSIKKGEKGGWIEDIKNLSGSAWVYGEAEVYGYKWKVSPLQIQGTQHFVNVCAKGVLRIGCFELPFKEWMEKFKVIGKREGYTPTQIKEYGLYIDLAIKLYPERKKRTATKKT